LGLHNGRSVPLVRGKGQMVLQATACIERWVPHRGLYISWRGHPGHKHAACHVRAQEKRFGTHSISFGTHSINESRLATIVSQWAGDDGEGATVNRKIFS
jgi:hypothetical protein